MIKESDSWVHILTHLNSDGVSTNSLASQSLKCVCLSVWIGRYSLSLPSSLYCLYSTSMLSDPNLSQGGILKKPLPKRLVLKDNVEWKIWEQTSLCFFLVLIKSSLFSSLSMILAMVPWVPTLCETRWSISPICVDRFKRLIQKKTAEQTEWQRKPKPSAQK